MQRLGDRPRLQIHNGPKKKDEEENLPNLSPDLGPLSPPTFCNTQEENPFGSQFLRVGCYVIRRSDSGEDSTAVNEETGDEFTCQFLPLSSYRQRLSTIMAADGHPNVSTVHQLLLTQSSAIALFPRRYGDLHTYVRGQKRLSVDEARALVCQAVAAVEHSHSRGLVLPGLKLASFHFTDAKQTKVVLDVSQAVLLEDADNDLLQQKHGCPAYVSPEILDFSAGQAGTKAGYSGRQADMWSVGIMIYTMLAGRYPFAAREPRELFTRIRRCRPRPAPGSPRAASLVASLLLPHPADRLTAAQAADHPWLARGDIGGHEQGLEKSDAGSKEAKGVDHEVPCWQGSGSDQDWLLL